MQTGLEPTAPPVHRIPRRGGGADIVTCDDLTHVTCLGALAASRPVA